MWKKWFRVGTRWKTWKIPRQKGGIEFQFKSKSELEDFWYLHTFLGPLFNVTKNGTTRIGITSDSIGIGNCKLRDCKAMLLNQARFMSNNTTSSCHLSVPLWSKLFELGVNSGHIEKRMNSVVAKITPKKSANPSIRLKGKPGNLGMMLSRAEGALGEY